MKFSPRVALIAVAVLAALVVPVVVARSLGGGSTTQPTVSSGPTRPVYGDGRAGEAHDLRIANVQLPARAGVAGTVSVEILDQLGRPVTAMVRDQTKLVQLYIVRGDLSVFRHVHPTYADGTWSARVTLPTGGTYRVIAEFTVDSGNHNDHVVLAADADLAGVAERLQPLTAGDGYVQVDLLGGANALENGALSAEFSTAAGKPARLGRFLGSSAYVVGFHAPTGTMVRLYPMGKPKKSGDATALLLRAPLRLPGPYAFFIQVTSGGQQHTLLKLATIG